MMGDLNEVVKLDFFSILERVDSSNKDKGI